MDNFNEKANFIWSAAELLRTKEKVIQTAQELARGPVSESNMKRSRALSRRPVGPSPFAKP